MVLNPLTQLHGKANQATEFYCQTLGSQCSFKNTYENSPMEIPQSQKDWILHSELSLDNQPFLMVADVDHIENGNNSKARK